MLRTASAKDSHTHLPWSTVRLHAVQLLKTTGRLWRRDAAGKPLWPDDAAMKAAVKVRLTFQTQPNIQKIFTFLWIIAHTLFN